MKLNDTDLAWKVLLTQVLNEHDYVVSPRGIEVLEIINGYYNVDMNTPFISIKERKVNYGFMFAEAAWIVEGSNRLSKITPYMKSYMKFSDDNVFMSGSYGVKIVEQLRYVVDSLMDDQDSRQAVLTTWRERPGKSKDIPCTISMQFLVRGGSLNSIVNMRSHDIVKGFTYDVFTFSMVCLAVKLLLKERGVEVKMGRLYVNAGSLHLYKDDVEKTKKWISNNECVKIDIKNLYKSKSYEQLIENLWKEADNAII